MAVQERDRAQEEGKAYEELDTEGHSSILVWMITLGSETWLAAVSWVAVIAYFQTFYWHVLSPRNLGVDLQSIFCYGVVMVATPLILEIPQIVKLLSHKICSVLLAALVVAACLYGNETDDERQRSTAYLVAMFLTGVRCVAIAGQKAPDSGHTATERSLAPWAVSLGLLAVLVARLAFTWLHPMRETMQGKAIFAGISVVALLMIMFCSPGASEGLIEGETCCGCCVASGGSLFSATAIATLAMFSLWLLDAPWAVPHFTGLYGHTYQAIMVAAYAAGIVQSMFLPMWPCATMMVVIEIVGGGALLCMAPLQMVVGGVASDLLSFVGGCMLAFAMPTAWMFGQQQASQSVQGRAAGLTMSLAGLVLLVQLTVYWAVLTNVVPILSAIFWGKFELFAVFLVVCLIVGLLPTFLSSLTLHTEISHEARCITSIWVLLLLIAGGALQYMAITAPKQVPQFTDRGLVVGSFNVQQGYKTDGETNFDCVEDVFKLEMPHVVGLQESDSIHMVSGNVNVLGYLADKLGLYRTTGPAGYRSSVGVSILSEYPLQVVDKANPSGAHQLPSTNGSTLNRFLVHSRIEVNGTNVSIISVHTEWFGDPAIQMRYIADYIGNVSGPLVLMGDFNLDVSGQNTATIEEDIKTSGFQALIASPGLKSASPLSTPSCTMVNNDNISYCPGALTTVDMANSTTPGYQLDFIWYRDLVLVSGLEVSNASRNCSDHLFVKAAFELIPNAKASVAPATATGVKIAVAPVTTVTKAPVVTPAPVAKAVTTVTKAPITAAAVLPVKAAASTAAAAATLKAAALPVKTV